MPLISKDAMLNDIKYTPFKKIDHKALVKHQWYINNRRNGDTTPKTRGRPFFKKTKKEESVKTIIEIIEPKIEEQLTKEKQSRRRKMNCVEKRRRAIELKLEKLNKKAAEFKASLLLEHNV